MKTTTSWQLKFWDFTWWYKYGICYEASKELYTDDVLSRNDPMKHEKDMKRETETYIHTIMECLPTTERCFEELKEATRIDGEYATASWNIRRMVGHLKSISQCQWNDIRPHCGITSKNKLLVHGNCILYAISYCVRQWLIKSTPAIIGCRQRACQSLW